MKGILKTVVTAGLLAVAIPSRAQDAPTLRLGDPMIAFVPGLFSYDRHRGSSGASQAFPSFGFIGQSVTVTALDIEPHDDWPDLKGRVSITLAEDEPLDNPSGVVTVRGYQYHRDPINPTLVTRSSVHEDLQFTSAHSNTTTVYFDEVTSIETPGLGMYVRLTARWWFGHEQEMNVGVAVDHLSEADCGDYVVYFNGQEAAVEWNEDAGHCGAGLSPSGPTPGLYFGLDAPGEGDAFLGHPPEREWDRWLDSLPYGGFFFDVTDGEDTMIRPIVVDLVRRSDAKVVDTARVLLAIHIGPHGQPMLVPMSPAASMPGAFAQLSPRGLGRLDPTHADTLPYPIVPAGTQPRLSERAIALARRVGSGSAAFDLGGVRYWTRSRSQNGAGGGPEFAGYVAYEEILEEAQRKHRRFVRALGRCSGRPPLLAALCAANVTGRHCVRTPPVAADFTVRVEALTTYFDPARTEDALVVGDVTAMELAFGQDEVTSRFLLASIAGKMEGRIDPSDVRIEYRKDPLDPCTIKPDDRVLGDVGGATDDYGGWFVCPALGFAAASASMADPLPFDLVPAGESLQSPMAGEPEFTLAGVAGHAGTGTCGEPWMAAFTKAEIAAWQPTVADTIEADWVISPGQDEALDRLLSPLELGIESVDAPPAGTPAYTVHPLGTYTLSARIGSTANDTEVFRANTPDGLYVPYITRSSPAGSEPFLTWFCPFANGQRCDGLQGTHDPSFPNGRDPDGEPFDVALSFTTAHLNQALWAQARRSDRLGAPDAPARLAIGPAQVALRAAELGYVDVVAALVAAGKGAGFGLRYHQAAAPYTLVMDEPPRLWYVAPNIMVELVAFDGDGGETVAATFVVDVVEKNLQLTLAPGGASWLDAAWRDPHVLAITSTYLPGCYRDLGGGGCADRLRQVVGELVRPAIESTLLELITTLPGLQLFDAGQESARPRHVTNARTFLGPGVNLFGDLCRPGAPSCP